MPRSLTKYALAIEWIAGNDNPGNEDTLHEILDYITTSLVADIFGREPIHVALDVKHARIRMSNREREERIAARTLVKAEGV